MDEINLESQSPCPFCGSHELRTAFWADDDGEYDAIECCNCNGAAPAEWWNQRAIKNRTV